MPICVKTTELVLMWLVELNATADGIILENYCEQSNYSYSNLYWVVLENY